MQGTITRATENGRAIPARPRARRLPLRWRQLLLTLHIIVSVGLLGTDATVLLLAITGARGADPRTVYPAAQLIGGTLLVPLALLALVSGIALGLLTPWGLVRHWWVTIKLVLTAGGARLPSSSSPPRSAWQRRRPARACRSPMPRDWSGMPQAPPPS